MNLFIECISYHARPTATRAAQSLLSVDGGGGGGGDGVLGGGDSVRGGGGDGQALPMLVPVG